MRVNLWSPVALLLAGCDLFGTAHPSGKPVMEAYGGSHELRVLDVETPLRREMRIPILSTPQVFAAFVPAHTERDLFVGDHFLYFKISDSEWFSQRLQSPEPPVTGDAPPESMRPLRELDWTNVI